MPLIPTKEPSRNITPIQKELLGRTLGKPRSHPKSKVQMEGKQAKIPERRRSRGISSGLFRDQNLTMENKRPSDKKILKCVSDLMWALCCCYVIMPTLVF
jgi:hypothetical protein